MPTSTAPTVAWQGQTRKPNGDAEYVIVTTDGRTFSREQWAARFGDDAR